MTQQHATRADIEAILEARKKAVVEQVTPASIPALPPRKTAPAPATQTTPITQPVAVPSVQAAPTPQVDDGEVETFLQAHLPGLITAAVELARPPFNWSEVITLGGMVSAAVAQGLPQMRGLEARALVVVIVRYVWRQYGAPALPATVRPFAGLLETLIVAGLEAAYQLAVKRPK